MKRYKLYKKTPPKPVKGAPKDDAKYDQFTEYIGDWEVISLRLAGYNPLEAQRVLKFCSKVWMARALTTKYMFDG